MNIDKASFLLVQLFLHPPIYEGFTSCYATGRQHDDGTKQSLARQEHQDGRHGPYRGHHPDGRQKRTNKVADGYDRNEQPLEGTSTVNTPQTRKEEVVSFFSVSHHCLCRSDPIKCTETFSEIGGRSKTGHISYLTDIVLPGFKQKHCFIEPVIP